MPQWLKTMFSRQNHALVHRAEGVEHEWAEFNLPANCDLRALLTVSAVELGKAPDVNSNGST